jgi:hypothetical protein
MSAEFQRWLYHRQFDATLCKRNGAEIGWVGNQLKFSGGFGFSYGVMAMNYMFLSFEMGKIYRPKYEFVWANHPPNTPCTLNISTLDCYSRPLSSCGIEMPLFGSFGYEPMLNTPYHGIFPTTDKLDLCTLAERARKPLIWVYGNVMMYLLRPRTDIQIQIDDRIAYVTRAIKPGTSFITVHVRGGELDANRVVVPLDAYMAAVETKATELSELGKPVSVVYLASNDNGHIFQSESFLHSRYNSTKHNYAFKILNMTFWNFEKEVELIVKENKQFDRWPLAVEFLADLQLMVEADTFIGSHSSIYVAAAAIRYGKYFQRPRKQTCLISDFDQHSLLCEGDFEAVELKKIWNQYICGGGFKGGDSLWPKES